MMNTGNHVSRVQLAMLHDSLRLICDLPTIKCSGKIRARIVLDCNTPGGAIAIQHTDSGREITLLHIDGRWILTAHDAIASQWHLGTGSSIKTVLELIDRKIQHSLLGIPKYSPISPPSMNSGDHHLPRPPCIESCPGNQSRELGR